MHSRPNQIILANFGIWCKKKLRRAAEWAHTGKPKVSRVTWEHEEDMIPLSQVCLSPKTGLYGVKNYHFSPKKGHFGQSGPQNGPPCGRRGTYRKTEGIQSYLRTW